MKNEKIVAGLDGGHISTKAILTRGRNILGFAEVPTGIDPVFAAKEALSLASKKAGITFEEISEIFTTGIFKYLLKDEIPMVEGVISDHEACLRGAIFLNGNARTVIDMGGNVQKVISCDPQGHLTDVVQNDKCADGLGLFYTTMCRTLGLTYKKLSDLSDKSKNKVSVSIHCATSAESELIDLLCQGFTYADCAFAAITFIAERIVAMCNAIKLREEILAVGGLARSKQILKRVSNFLRREIKTVRLPEYVVALGAALGGGQIHE